MEYHISFKILFEVRVFFLIGHNGFVYDLLRDSGLNLVKKIGIENPPRDFRM